MFKILREIAERLLKTRIFILLLIIVLLFLVLVQHLFNMQIIHGNDYQETYTESIQKTITVDGVRGNIYDKNGVLLAYNKLAYKVTLQDSGTYSTTKEKNAALNQEINRIIELIQAGKDSIENNFSMTYHKSTGKVTYGVSGTALQRFRADVFGHSKISDLSYNKKLGGNEATASASDVYAFLLNQYGLDTKEIQNSYTPYRIYQILVVRYALAANSYQKYVSTTIAKDVSDETVAAIKENSDSLEGVSIENDTKRVYTYPEYLSGVIGYVGQISTDEYSDYSKDDSTYSLSDYVGKTGIEKVMESQLRGKKGRQEVYVNNVGKIQKVISSTSEQTGNNVYLSIDAKLQKAVYQLLEQEIAGILSSSLEDTKSTSSKKNIFASSYEVYTALLTNNVIDLDQLPSAKSGTVSAKLYSSYRSRRKTLLKSTRAALNAGTRYKDLSDTMQDYISYIVKYLQGNGVFDSNMVDSSNRTYKAWKKGTISAKEYLEYAIEQNWIDISSLNIRSKYSDIDELYKSLTDYVISEMSDNSGFDKLIYKDLLYSDSISGRDVCLVLYEQKVLKKDSDYSRLKSGAISSYAFIRSKIHSLKITPGQLGLDPCSGSCVIMDPNNGSVLACVSYPGYDTNKLSNAENSDYYNDLLTNASLPLYNNATQQTTAPGSTFKLLSSVAGLTEGRITTGTTINDTGIYTKQGMNLKCWVYPSNHGNENVSQAIRDSCNYFFAEVGYRLSLKNGKYNESAGVKNIQKYAKEMGLGSRTGVEIAESNSQMASEQPIPAAIGQSNNAYTTIQLARYVSAIANQGTVYDLTLLSKVTSASGKTRKTYHATEKNQMNNVSSSTWSAIKTGMIGAVKEHKQFNGVTSVKLAGKTGTAQESQIRPNHALFVGFAPYDNPKIAIATRIAHGYSSSNACSFVAKVMEYYFGLKDKKDLLKGTASSSSSSSNGND